MFFKNVKVQTFYYLPPEIYPHEPLETKDKRYLDYAFSTVVLPFNNILQLDIYKVKLFRLAPKVSIILNTTTSNSISCADFQPRNDRPTAEYLFKNLSLDMPSSDKFTTLL